MSVGVRRFPCRGMPRVEIDPTEPDEVLSVNNSRTTKPSTPNSPSLEKSSSGLTSFACFIQNGTGRIMKTPRGDLIATYRTLINARAFPAIASWAELYRFAVSRGSSDATIAEARRLWNEYRKSQPAIVPPIASTSERAAHG
jgi:hypothetical protein